MPARAWTYQRSTLADWVGQTSSLLRPLYDALAEHVLGGHAAADDDTRAGVVSGAWYDQARTAVDLRARSTPGWQ